MGTHPRDTGPPTPGPGRGEALLIRGLRIVTRVEGPELRSALLLFASVFLILTAYYLIKPAREGWLAVSAIATLSKVEIKAYASFGQVLLLLVVMSPYTSLVGRWPRGSLVLIVNLFLAANLVLFWLFQPGMLVTQVPYLGVAFYLWVGIFNVFIVAQFWAYVADFYALEQGRRLVPLVALGANAGAVFGSWFAEELVQTVGLLSFHLMLCALVPLLAAILLLWLAERRGPLGRGLASAERAPAAPAESRRGALALIARHPMLLGLAVLTIVYGWAGANGENVLFAVVQDAIAAEAVERGITAREEIEALTLASTTGFYGNFYFWVNVGSLTLQALFVTRLLRFGGFGTLFYALPLVTLFGYLAMALVPLLTVIKTAKILENSTNYSVHNTARGVFWLPTTSEMKFKAKQAVDTLFVRLGDGFAALTVLIGITWLELEPIRIFWLNVALALVWLVLALRVVRRRKVLLKEQT